MMMRVGNMVRSGVAALVYVRVGMRHGAVPMRMTPDAFGKFLEGDIAKWAKVIEKAGLKPQ